MLNVNENIMVKELDQYGLIMSTALEMSQTSLHVYIMELVIITASIMKMLQQSAYVCMYLYIVALHVVRHIPSSCINYYQIFNLLCVYVCARVKHLWSFNYLID